MGLKLFLYLWKLIFNIIFKEMNTLKIQFIPMTGFFNLLPMTDLSFIG